MKHTRVVVHSTRDVLARLPGEHWLNPDEDARLQRLLRPEDRDDFRAAHHLVRQVAADRLGADPAALDLRQRCDSCGGPHGRPRVLLDGAPAPVHVSLSHSHGWVAAAASGNPVGVDIEARLLSPEALRTTAPRVCTPGEWATVRACADPPARFARLWVVKESLVKLGVTTLDGLRDLDVGRAALAPDGQPATEDVVTVAGAQVRLWDAPHPHAVAVLPGDQQNGRFGGQDTHC